MNAAAQSSPAAISGKSYGFWHYVWKLLRLRLVITVSGFRRAKIGRKIATIFLALLVVGFGGFLFWLSWGLLGLLRSPQLAEFINPQALLESMPTAVVSLATLAIMLTNFGVLLQALYLAGDMDFLLSAPLPRRAVFLTKLIQAILPNIGLVLILCLPVLFGLGVSSGYSALYYPLVLAALVFLTMAAGGVSSLLVMAIVRIIPARRVAEVLGFVGAILSVLLSQSGRLLGESNISNNQLGTGLSALSRFNVGWSPLAWVGRGLVDIGEGRWISGLLLLGLSLGLAGAAFWVTLSLAERLYYSGWATMQGSPVRRKASRQAAKPKTGLPGPQAVEAEPSTVSPLAGRLPAQFRALLWKDFIMLRRDLRNLSNLITPLILGVLLVVSMARRPFGGGGQQASPVGAIGPDLGLIVIVGFSLFVGWSLVSNLAMSGFSREGKNYWLVQVAPVRTGTLLGVKFLVAFLPSLLFQWILLAVFAILQRIQAVTLLYGGVVMALSVAGAVGVNLAFGVRNARLDWTEPRKMNSTAAGCVGTLVSFIYLGISLAFFFLPPVIFNLVGWGQPAGQLVGLLAGGLFGLACAILPLALVWKRVNRIGMA